MVENAICNDIANKKMSLEDLVFIEKDFDVSELIKREGEADEEFSLRVLGLLHYQYTGLGLRKIRLLVHLILFKRIFITPWKVSLECSLSHKKPF